MYCAIVSVNPDFALIKLLLDQDLFIVFHLEHVDLRHIRQLVVFGLQLILFIFLYLIGHICGLVYMHDDCLSNACYFSTHARLLKLERTMAIDCSDPTNSVCSHQTRIYAHFFKVKMLITYYSAIIITMVYIWHRTVRLLACFLVLFLIVLIVFCTDLILYLDNAVYVSSMVCVSIIVSLSTLMAHLFQNIEDLLSVVCGQNVPSDDLYEFLLNDTSKRACFYRWTKKLKKKWHIEEEKLILSIITIVLSSIIAGFIAVHVLPVYL